jgi:predicted amidophosphoribosyltransferase
MPPGQCPVCRARFRGTRLCSRCGADLTPLMLLTARAWHLRERAREALRASDAAGALRAAAGAEKTQHTPAGAALLAVARLAGAENSDGRVSPPSAAAADR